MPDLARLIALQHQLSPSATRDDIGAGGSAPPSLAAIMAGLMNAGGQQQPSISQLTSPLTPGAAQPGLATPTVQSPLVFQQLAATQAQAPLMYGAGTMNQGDMWAG